MNNRELLENYVKNNHDKLNSFVRNRMSNNESEDIVQTIYYRMLKNDSTLKNEDARDGYLKKAARLNSYSVFKKKSNLDIATDIKFQMEDVCCSKADKVNYLSEMAEVALSCLAEPLLSTVKSFYLESKTINEISENTNTPEGTVKRRLHVARGRMKQFMEANGYESSDVFV